MILSYNEYKSSLKETSKDNSGNENIYMTELTNEVINFDDFVDDFFKQVSDEKKGKSQSIDALCKIDDNWCFIEFKNGSLNRNEKRGISAKIGHSLLVFLRNENIKISDVCDKIIFILVYNEMKNYNNSSLSRENIEKYILSKAKTRVTRFDLGKYQKVYFNNVFTFTEKEFEDFISKHNVTCPLVSN